MKEVSENRLAAVMGRADGHDGGRRSVRCRGGSGLGLGFDGVRFLFLRRRCGIWLLLPLAKPRGLIDVHWG